MTREEICKLAIDRGFNYNPETGQIFGARGNEVIGKICGYINFKIRKNKICYTIRGHQFAWYWVNKECVDCIDHINGIKDDNRICNLRSVTKQENAFNNKKAKGYAWHKQRNKWRARIRVNGKLIDLGNFNSKEEARSAYVAAKEKYHKIN